MEQAIKVSEAEFTDLNVILEIQKEVYLEEARIYNDFNLPPLKQNVNELMEEWQSGMIIKAEIDGQIVGSVRATLVNDVCRIGKLIVKTQFQNQGIGKRLMYEIEKLFENCRVYELFTGNKSEKNLAIYKKLGYHNYREEQVNDNLKLIYLQKINPTVVV